MQKPSIEDVPKKCDVGKEDAMHVMHMILSFLSWSQ